MTKVKLCGIKSTDDIQIVNEIKPDFAGFVFAAKSSRYINYEQAEKLKKLLSPQIKAVGVFVKEELTIVAKLLNEGIIDIAQLHGGEDSSYIQKLIKLTNKPVIQAFIIKSDEDIEAAKKSFADYVLLDSGAGTGEKFDWQLIKNFPKNYFLAGGLTPKNVSSSVKLLHPYAVDVSSGIETNGKKDREKIIQFVKNVRDN